MFLLLTPEYRRKDIVIRCLNKNLACENICWGKYNTDSRVSIQHDGQGTHVCSFVTVV